MDKHLIKQMIVAKQSEIQSIRLVPRSLNLEPTLNYVFVGLRRAGKSYMLAQHIQNLIATGQARIDDMLYINFEDERITGMRADELHLFIESYAELYDARPIIFLDEIQNITGWEKFARRLADEKYRVFITGSNAKMLSKEIYTTLGGRYAVQEVYPFSFQEFLRFHAIELSRHWAYNDTKTKVMKLCEDYLHFGGLAETFLLNDKRSWLNALYQKLLLGDVILRNVVRNENAIRVLAKKLAESVMQRTSLVRLKHIIESTGTTIARNTLVDYLQFMQDAYIIFEIPNYTETLAERETIKKRYFIDNGILNLFLFEPEPKLLENIVAITLKRKCSDDLFYFNRQIEVDFFLPRARRAIQVSYRMIDDTTREREVKALCKLADIYPVDQLEIVTWEEENTLIVDGLTIHIIPLYRWLIDN